MSVAGKAKKITTNTLQEMKSSGEKITMLTAYDFSLAKLVDEGGVDVILVGELRDLETISLALTAAETGHLVFGTLHTNGAPNTIHRIVDVFPSAQQSQIRSQFATCIKLVMTQRLIKKADHSGRVPAFEIMVSNIAIQNLIRENKIFQIPSVMQTSVSDGMIQMEKSNYD